LECTKSNMGSRDEERRIGRNRRLGVREKKIPPPLYEEEQGGC
jgi:hypothetical protein